MRIDTPTVVVISALIDCVLLLILIHTRRTRTTYPGFVAWIAGTACWTFGSTLVLLFSELQPRFLPKVLGNTLVMFHPLLLYVGIQQFYGVPPRWWRTPLNLLLVGTFLACQLHFLYVAENLGARTIVINLVLAVLFARVALEPLLLRRARQNSMQWLLSLSLLPLIAILLTRAALYTTIHAPATFQVMIDEEVLLRWLLFYAIIVEIAIAYSYLSLTSDRVEEELRLSETRYRDLSATLQQRVEAETERRMAQERLLAQNARLAAMGQMTAVIAHQWRQPLTTLGMILQRLEALHQRGRLTDTEFTEARQSGMRQIESMSETIDDFRQFYSPDRVRLPFSSGQKLREAVALVKGAFDSAGVALEQSCAANDDDRLHGYPNQFAQALVNLLNNAREATLAGTVPEGAKPRVVIRGTAAAGQIIITVADNGGGIPHEMTERLFEPFVTSKEGSGGSGLGLYLARTIVEDGFSGRLYVQSCPGETIFTAILPTRPQED